MLYLFFEKRRCPIQSAKMILRDFKTNVETLQCNVSLPKFILISNAFFEKIVVRSATVILKMD